MTPVPTLERGTYRINSYVTNPEGEPRQDDWRRKQTWEPNTVFHCFDVYFDGRVVPAIYAGNRPQDHVHEFVMPNIYHLLLPYLTKT